MKQNFSCIRKDTKEFSIMKSHTCNLFSACGLSARQWKFSLSINFHQCINCGFRGAYRLVWCITVKGFSVARIELSVGEQIHNSVSAFEWCVWTLPWVQTHSSHADVKQSLHTNARYQLSIDQCQRRFTCSYKSNKFQSAQAQFKAISFRFNWRIHTFCGRFIGEGVSA